jgi:uncharacterized protein YyaL (SSP411 family)
MAHSRNSDIRLNHLIHEKSPYLLQHVENPVDWYPWGDEAFQKAKSEEKPVFLSIGYATCHWCHVMAHESFEDEEVARVLNRSFVAVKVDREERPDVDQIYMSVCQALTGQGGWPLSIFMTPEGSPFFAGTYFPKQGRMGMPGFIDLLQRIAAAWQAEREKIIQGSAEIRRVIRQEAVPAAAEGSPAQADLRKAYVQLSRSFDVTWGGFGKAPKFPSPHHLTFLLRWLKRQRDPQAEDMVTKTLEAMRQGGIFDHLGFGFHRYSVDERWLVPHFEKMLYDQAMLAMAYVEAYQALGREKFAQTAREIFAYVLRDLTSPEGGFYSAEDADSEGREGLFYIWTPAEVKKHLGAETGDLFCRFYGITSEGNFEDGLSIPHESLTLEAFAAREKIPPGDLEKTLAEAREKLFRARERRVHPLKDDKILTAWNGLMIAALAKGAGALQDPALASAAAKAADFILQRMRTASGRLRRRYRLGDIAYAGYLDDYAYFIWGLIELYEATFNPRYLAAAVELHRLQVELFWDGSAGGFFMAAKDAEELIARPKDLYDGAVPSGNSVALLNLLRLGRMCGNTDWEKMADRMIRGLGGAIGAHPMAYTHLMIGLDFFLGPTREIVIAGNPEGRTVREMVTYVQQAFLPFKILLLRPDGEAGRDISSLCPFLEAMKPGKEGASVYICEGYSCKTPVSSLSELQTALS